MLQSGVVDSDTALGSSSETPWPRFARLTSFQRAALEIWAGEFWLHGDSDRYPGGRYNDPAFEAEHLARLLRD